MARQTVLKNEQSRHFQPDIMSTQLLLSALSLVAMLTIATALPMHRRSESTVTNTSANTTTNLLINAPSNDTNTSPTSMLDDLILSLPDCSYSNHDINHDQSNRTYIDLRIGLKFVMKKYLGNVLVSVLLQHCISKHVIIIYNYSVATSIQ